MQALQVFSFKGADVRTVMVDSEPYWVAADVCAILGLSGAPAQHLRRLDDDEKGVISIHTPGGIQEVAGVNESGLYSLMLGSKKAEAKAVKKWLTSEVLPSIRKTGGYGVPQVSEVDKLAMVLQVALPGMTQAIAAADEKADRALAAASIASTEAVAAIRQDMREAAKLRGLLAKKVAQLGDEALARGFYDGNKRRCFQAINEDLRDRFGVRAAMPVDMLQQAIAYILDRHTKLTSPNRLDVGA